MRECLSLSRTAYNVIEPLFERGNTTINGGLLDRFFGHSQVELLADSWLVHCGTETEIFPTDDERRPFEYLEWDSNQRRYRYFNPHLGWVVVDSARLKHYAVNEKQFLTLLQQQLDIPARQKAATLKGGSVWYLGIVRMGGYRLHCYFSRPIFSWDERVSFLRTMETESAHVPVVVLMPGDGVPKDVELPLDMAILPIDLVIDRDCDEFRLDFNRMILHLKRYPRPESQGEQVGLRFTSDYRIVVWNGATYRLSKKQAAVVEKLDEEGGRAHKDVLRAVANTDLEIRHIMRCRINGTLQYHPLWNTLIRSEGNGFYCLATTEQRRKHSNVGREVFRAH